MPVVTLLIILSLSVTVLASRLEDVDFRLSDKKIHIQNNSVLHEYLKETSSGSLDVARTTKGIYRIAYQKDIKITDLSLATEILGHVYPDKIARWIPFNLGSKIIDRTSVIDCGEASVDENRFVWDTMSDSFIIINRALSQPTFITGPIPKLRNSVTPEFIDSMTNFVVEELNKEKNKTQRSNRSNSYMENFEKEMAINILTDYYNGNIDSDILYMYK